MTTLIQALDRIVTDVMVNYELSRTCIPNFSCDYFNKSCSAKGKITPAVILPNTAQKCMLYTIIYFRMVFGNG